MEGTEKNISENELVSQCISGKRQYQEMLYRKYADKMYNVSLTYTKDDDEACDILQESFIKVFKSLHTFQNKGSLEGWIRKIVVNTALDFYRKSKREREFIEEYKNYSEPEINEVIEKINAEDLIKIVNQLPAKAAMVLKLFAIEGYNHKEIAEVMEITEGTSKSQLNRARCLIKESIGKYNG